jgi:HSP20 family protein
MTFEIRKSNLPLINYENCPECLPFYGAGLATRWVPPVDVYEKDNKLIFKMEIPEVKPEDINLNVENNIITISGKRDIDSEYEENKRHRTERWYGEFKRSFSLPEWADNNAIDAEFKNGLLKIGINRKPEEKQVKRQIEIK